MVHSFFGGVHPDDRKQLACDRPTVPFAPRQVVIPMSQHIGAPCQPLVKKGDTVTVGQRIGDNSGLCVPVHASVSGTVVAVEPRPNTSGVPVMSVVIENDGLDTPCPERAAHETLDGLTPDELMDIIHQAGIAGMGGAAFPTHVKLSSGVGKVDTILLNASECEPYITADDRLCREYPEKIVAGLQIIMKILSLSRAHIVVEDNKPQAAKALRTQIDAASGITVDILPAKYPQGAEKQLIYAITGRRVPSGGLPAAVGCAVFNVATCKAICDAVYDAMPLIARVVTVSGDISLEPKNLMVPIGTSFNELCEAVGHTSNPYKVLSGGPMMGYAQFDLSVPIVKGTNAVTMLGFANRFCVEKAHCLHCGKCMDVCPMGLMPLYLYRAERENDLDTLQKLHLNDCMECGCCAYTCPAVIPLVQSFRAGKQKLREKK